MVVVYYLSHVHRIVTAKRHEVSEVRYSYVEMKAHLNNGNDGGVSSWRISMCICMAKQCAGHLSVLSALRGRPPLHPEHPGTPSQDTSNFSFYPGSVLGCFLNSLAGSTGTKNESSSSRRPLIIPRRLISD